MRISVGRLFALERLILGEVHSRAPGAAEFADDFARRLRDHRFWAIQLMVAAVTAIHWSLEAIEHRAGADLGGAYFAFTYTMYLVPVIYASLNFGLEGAMPTAIWSALLTVPNMLVWHEGFDRTAEALQMLSIVVLAAIIASRVNREVTARRRAEEEESARRLSEAKYRALFENAGEGVFVLDQEGRIVECNTGAGALLQRSPEALRNSLIDEVLPSELASVLRAAVFGLNGGPNEVRLMDADGREIWVEPVCTRLAEEGLSQVLLRNITAQKQRELHLETYAALILRAQEDERRRIAQELHDETMQSLVLLGRQLSAFEHEDPPTSAESRARQLHEARALAESIVGSMRRVIHSLRPPILDDLGLIPAIRKLLADVASRSSMDGQLAIQGGRERLSGDLEVELFRIAQEALHNIERHGEASRVKVSLSCGRKAIRLVIQDDGKGFSVPLVLDDLAYENKMGLIGMRERARRLGGKLTIDSAPGSGVTIIAEIPCDERR